MNLLPKQYKDNLKEGFKRRFWVATLFTAAISFLLGFIMLLPAYFLIPKNLGEAEEVLYVDVNDIESASHFLSLPERIDFKLRFLQNNLGGPSITGIFAEIVSDLPEGVVLDSVSFEKDPSRGDKIPMQVSISGNSASRESLISFSNALRESAIFTEVNLPVSNLARERDLPFSMQMIVKNQQ
jgi:hypothetical protein